MVNKCNELKKRLRPLEGVVIFTLTRVNSLNDGTFIRILHRVKPHELVFFDGIQLTYLPLIEEELTLLDNGFIQRNCTFTIKEKLNVNN